MDDDARDLRRAGVRLRGPGPARRRQRAQHSLQPRSRVALERSRSRASPRLCGDAAARRDRAAGDGRRRRCRKGFPGPRFLLHQAPARAERRLRDPPRRAVPLPPRLSRARPAGKRRALGRGPHALSRHAARGAPARRAPESLLQPRSADRSARRLPDAPAAGPDPGGLDRPPRAQRRRIRGHRRLQPPLRPRAGFRARCARAHRRDVAGNRRRRAGGCGPHRRGRRSWTRRLQQRPWRAHADRPPRAGPHPRAPDGEKHFSQLGLSRRAAAGPIIA